MFSFRVFSIILALVALPPSAKAENFRPPHLNCITSDPVFGFRPKPFCKSLAQSVDGQEFSIQLNSAGLWEREFSPRPAKGVLRILLIGDSWLVPHAENAAIGPMLEKMLLPRKVELVNGAANGFSLVQSYLLLPELLLKYKPGLVVFLLSPHTNMLNTFFHHEIGQKAEFVTQLSALQKFWLVPDFLQEKLWAQKYAMRLYLYSTALHELFLTLKDKVTGGERMLDSYVKYTAEMARLAEATGAKTLGLRMDWLPKPGQGKKGRPLLSYKSESIADSLWPWPLLTTKHSDEVFRRLEGKVKIEPLSPELSPLFMADSKLYMTGDTRHLKVEGIKLLAEHIHKALLSAGLPKP